LKTPRSNGARRAGPRAARTLIFRLIAVALPFLALLVTEIALRLAGVGHPTSFFLHTKQNGREMLRDNPKFGWRFFPAAIARTPEPAFYPAQKAPGTCRIFVFGESAAMGDPDPAVGLPRMLLAMLETKFPGRKFEVINVAMTAINSHVIRDIARECAQLGGDFWIVYAGNNEVVGPFGGGTVFGAQTPPLGLIRLTLWAKTTRIGQSLERLRSGGPTEWEGMEMFLKQQVPHDNPRLAKVHASFQSNLRDIIASGRKAGAHVILSTVAVNLRDSPPFASQHSRVLPAKGQAEWDAAYKRGADAESAGKYIEALTAFREAQKIGGDQDDYAELRFHIGRCAFATGDFDGARRAFDDAKEFDTLRFRADDAINATIRSHGAAGVTLIDAIRKVAGISSNGIAGSEAFYEHVHFTFEGNYTLAKGFFEEIVRQLPAEFTRGSREGIPTAEQCARRLGWNAWKQHELFEEMSKRLRQPPFTAQFDHAERDAQWDARVEKLAAGLTPERLRGVAADYAVVLKESPDDWVLHEDYAKLLAAMGDNTNAIAQWHEVARLIPYDTQAYFHLGALSDGLGRQDEAISWFRKALEIDPSLAEARNGLGLALGTIGRIDDARREFERAIRSRPRFALARVNLGQLLASQGHTEAAREQYETALRIDTNSAAAHVNLGKLLSAEGNKAAAAEHYRAALRINPRNAVAHFNMANALVATNSLEALSHYRSAVLLKPDFVDARYALALELGKQNDMAGALEQLAEVVRLRPDFAEGHFNYGVALAKTGRFRPAINEFRETLRLNPGDKLAEEFLQKAKALAGE